MPLIYHRFAVVGTCDPHGKIQDPPRLLASAHFSAEQAAEQCKRFALQGWGCQVFPEKIELMIPTLEGMVGA